MAEHGEREACDGRIIAPLGQVYAEPFGERIGRHMPGDEQRPVVARDHRRRVGGVGVGRELARNRREQIGRGHDPFEMAVFVMDQCHRHFGLAQRVERIHRVDLIEYDGCLPHQRAKVERFALEQRHRDIARLYHPDDGVDRSFGDRQATVRGLHQRRTEAGIVERRVDPFDIGARRHHLAHRSVGEPHHARDDRAFMLLDHTRFARFGDDQVQFLGRDMFFALAFQAHYAEQQRRRRIEQPHHRRSRPGEREHRTRHRGGERFGRAERDLLGHELADDERGIGRDADYQRETDRLRRLRAQAEKLQPCGDWPAQARPRIGARQNADQRDTDLRGRQDLAGVGGKGERGARAAPPGARHRLQPRLA